MKHLYPDAELLELGDGSIIAECIAERITWRQCARVLRKKGWDAVDRIEIRDQIARVREEIRTKALLGEYDAHVHRELMQGKNPGDLEMPSLRPLPLSSFPSYRALRTPGRKQR